MSERASEVESVSARARTTCACVLALGVAWLGTALRGAMERREAATRMTSNNSPNNYND